MSEYLGLFLKLQRNVLIISGYTRIEENRCTDQMKVYLGIMYNYKWILPNILKVMHYWYYCGDT